MAKKTHEVRRNCLDLRFEKNISQAYSKLFSFIAMYVVSLPLELELGFEFELQLELELELKLELELEFRLRILKEIVRNIPIGTSLTWDEPLSLDLYNDDLVTCRPQACQTGSRPLCRGGT